MRRRGSSTRRICGGNGVVTLLQLIVLAVVQGITEFLPISSSGHLILVPNVAGWPDQGLQMDVAVHLGTLFAVLLYFWADVWEMVKGFVLLLRGRLREGGRQALLIIVATIPAIGAGYLIHEYAGDALRSMEVIAWTTIGFGVLLWIADRSSLQVREVRHLTVVDAVIIGCAQALALIPGTSRSGITMTAGRFLGMERAEAARFSLLLSIPTILAAGGLATLDLVEAGDTRLTLDAVIAAGLAFLSALVAISLMMAWLKRSGFGPFVLYRLGLGGILLWWVYA